MSSKLRVGVAGPVGSGKTALVETLCLSLKNNYEIAIVTNDIYTKEDANFLINKSVLEEGRIIGVETGGCPHTCLLYTSPSPRDGLLSRMPSSA